MDCLDVFVGDGMVNEKAHTVRGIESFKERLGAASKHLDPT